MRKLGRHAICHHESRTSSFLHLPFFIVQFVSCLGCRMRDDDAGLGGDLKADSNVKKKFVGLEMWHGAFVDVFVRGTDALQCDLLPH